MSKYHELAVQLRNEIANGTYPTGSRLPTLPKLCELYNVSNTTVKKAMDELEQLGLVARRRGSGIYVKSTPTTRTEGQESWSISGQMTGLTAEFAAKGKSVQSIVQEFSVLHPTEQVAEALGMRVEEFVYYICRVRVVDDVPQNVEYTHMPLTLIPGLREEHLYGSIYGYLENELQLKIGSAHRVLRAVKSSTDEQQWLRINPGDPLFEVRQIGYLDDGTPFEYSITHHTSDYEFYVVSTY